MFQKNILKSALKSLAFVGVALAMSNCAHDHKAPTEPIPDAGPKGHADATIEAKSGNKSVKGELHFMAKDGVLTATGQIEGLKPDHNHGFHIHETGDCSKADATSAGGHFSPNKGNVHAAHSDPNRHAGDMGNLKSDNMGVARVDIKLPGLNLNDSDDAYSIIGKAVIVHKDPDDLTSQPAGNAGARIGCGVIKKTSH